MKHLKLFEEFGSREVQKIADEMRSDSKEVLKAAEYWKQKMRDANSHLDFKSPGVIPGNYVVETPEDLNMERMEKRTIMNAIIKNYRLSNQQIADKLGLDRRSFHRKLDLYDLKDLKRQMRIRNGMPWKHPYNEIDPDL